MDHDGERGGRRDAEVGRWGGWGGDGQPGGHDNGQRNGERDGDHDSQNDGAREVVGRAVILPGVICIVSLPP